MLTSEGAQQGRVQVSTGAEYAEVLREKRDEGKARWVEGFTVALSGLTGHGKFSFPYPGPYGTTGQVVVLRRDQVADLTVKLLRQLAGRDLPDDKAELGDFIASVIREAAEG